MSDDFISLNNEANTLKSTIDKLYTIKEEVSVKCDTLRKEMDDIIVKNFSSSDSEKWKELEEKERQSVIDKVRKRMPESLKELRLELERGSITVVKEVWYVIGIGIGLLLLLVGFYIPLHYGNKFPSYSKDSTKAFFRAIGRIKSSIASPSIIPKEVSDAVNALDNTRNNWLTFEFTERISSLSGFISTLSEIPTNTTLQQTDQRITLIKEEIEKIENEAMKVSLNSGFFWITGYWRWLEIIFWGEFGVITGILVWVSTQAEAGKYTKGRYETEIYWYLAEVITGPIIVVAFFFLLRQFIGTFMTGLAEDEVRGSIYLTLGISFTLGLFIRRTLGIFDFIKEKLPLPKS